MSHSDSARRSLLSDIVIRKPKQTNKTQHHGRTHIPSPDDVVKPDPLAGDAEGPAPAIERAASASTAVLADTPPEQRADDLERIRALLLPPPIDGIENWGIPEPSTEPPEPAIEVYAHTTRNVKSFPAHLGLLFVF